MKDVKSEATHLVQHRCDRADRRTGKAQIVSHAIDIPADTAEIGLHVDDDQRGILRPKVTVKWPGIWVGGNLPLCHRLSPVLTDPIT